MIKHIVMWKLKSSAHGMNREDLALKIKADLETLPLVIPEIRALEVGINQKDSPAACDLSLYSEFNSWQDLETYQKHPRHKEVVNFVVEAVTDRHMVDYEK